ncbi:hypothetical protein JZM24_10815 [Candidatus Sodalis endolongispinus]|uniref:CAP-Gly protein n=1 Tax=Candidatus Sodalis endolongispinus TaxID=2812662 RepID=A0ABS5YD07_9GAMM|nr:hypothetical protein [Candidatus Sodalis endolongispinus]MBT9432494.1 hypothetical protein [Candidatus Sodalis endolongispinus]
METRDVAICASRVSWGSLFSGVLTALSISLLLALLGSALGFSMIDPWAQRPAGGVGTTMTICTAAALLISLLAGGFVAGRLAMMAGVTHGFLTWALSLLLAVIIGGFIISVSLRLAGNMLGAAGNAAGDIATTLGNNSGELAGALNNGLGKITLDDTLSSDASPKNITDALHPYYLQRQLTEIRSEVSQAVAEAMRAPERSQQIMAGLAERLKQRTDAVADEIKRDDVHQALASGNRSMTPEELNQATDKVMRAKQRAVDTIKQRIDTLQQHVSHAREDLQRWREELKQRADKAAAASAKSALWLFITLLLGAIVSAAGGWWGVRSGDRYHVG